MIVHTGFPKCGTTWFAQMTCELLGVKPIKVHGSHHWTEEELRAFIEENRDKPVSARSHFYPETNRIFQEYKLPVIFIYRHPADVVTSLHHHRVRKGHGTFEDFAGTCDDFAHSIPRLAWRDQPGVFVTRYEDVFGDPVEVLQEFGRYMGQAFTPRRIRTAIERCSFEEMWGREPGEEDPASFGRKGIVGDHVNFLVGERREYWDNRFPGIAEQWGYGRNYIPNAHASRRRSLPVRWFDLVVKGCQRLVPLNHERTDGGRKAA